MSKTALYYLILALILVGKAGTTLYQRSVVVQHGYSVAEYQTEQRKLLAQKVELSAVLADKLSLAKVQNTSETSQFVAIAKPIVITSQTNVASLR